MGLQEILEIIVKGKDQGGGSTIDGVNSKLSNLGNTLGKVGDSLTSAGKSLTTKVTAPLAAVGTLSVMAASDLEESMNAVNVVFGAAADKISAFGDTSAEMVGLAESDFNQLAAVTGAFLKNVGFDLQGAAEETINLTERAADMASIFNTDVDQALSAIQSGLKGEFNPLEQFGVKINAASIEAKALEMGLAATKQELDDNAKAQAALALIYEQTDQVAGDFRNTSDGLANSSRIMSAQLKDAAAALGQQLLPYVTQAVKWISGLVQKFMNLSPETQKVIVIIGAVAAAIGPLLVVIGSLIGAVGTIIGFFSSMAAVISGPLIASILPVIAIIAAVGAAIALLVVAWKNDWGGIQEKTKAVVDWIQTAVGNFVAWVTGAWESFTTFLKSLWDNNWMGIQDIVRNVVTVIQSIFAAFKSAFEGDWRAFGEHLRTAWDAIWDNIKIVLSNAWESLVQIARNIVDGIKGAFELDWGAIGRAIIDGIVNALVNGVNAVVDAAAAVAQGALDAAKGFLGIESPSKAFLEIGKRMMEGWGIGIERNARFPELQTVEVTRRLVQAPVMAVAGGVPVARPVREAREDYPGPARSVVIQHLEINNGMDLQDFRAMLQRVLNE